MHYIIGDIHGEYNMLLELIKKLPKDAKLIFVGDLIDRGLQSREVVKFIRENNHLVVRGNHEQFMIEGADAIIESLLLDEYVEMNKTWMFAGGIETLISYELLEVKEEGNQFVKNMEGIEALKSDVAWMKSLPLFIEMENPHNSKLPTVISHASIGEFWELRESSPEDFEFYVMTNRRNPPADTPILNIYGHTNVEKVFISPNFVKIDTGCGRTHGSAKLSAYCVESGEVFEVEKNIL